MSGSSGPRVFDVHHCATANDPPDTSAAGQTSRTPRRPDIVNTSQKGTSTDRNGSCRPTTCEIRWSSMPLTWPATTMGVPMAPKATGAVLAMRHSPAA